MGASLAGGEAALPSSLHGHLLVLAQPGRALLRPHHSTSHPSWLIQKRQEAVRQNQPLRPELQPQLEALRMVRRRRLHLPKTTQTLFAYSWDATLVSLLFVSAVTALMQLFRYKAIP